MGKALLVDYNIFEVSQKMITESENKNNGNNVQTIINEVNRLNRILLEFPGGIPSLEQVYKMDSIHGANENEYQMEGIIQSFSRIGVNQFGTN